MKYRESINYRPITFRQIAEIRKSAKGVDRSGLRSFLNEIAEEFIYAHYEQQCFLHADLTKRLSIIESKTTRLAKLLQSRSRSKKQLDRIGSAARTLHESLNFKVDDSIELVSILNFWHTGERDKTQRESFNGKLSDLVAVLKMLGDAKSWTSEIPDIFPLLDLLIRVVHHARTIQKFRIATSKDVNKGNHAFRDLFNNLCRGYMIYFRDIPAVSVGDGIPQGRFVTYVTKSLLAIKDNLSETITSSDDKIAKRLTVSSEAVRSLWRRSRAEIERI